MDPFSRRAFLKASGSGLLAAPLAPALLVPSGVAASPVAASPAAASPGADPVPVRAVGRPWPELERELPQPPEERVGYAVVGLGRYAMNQILPAFGESKRSKLVAVVSGNAEKRRRVADRYGIPDSGLYSYDDYDRIADNPDIQAIYNILPPGLHEEYSVRASQAGKHVLCEKPLARTAAECQRMIDAAEAADRLLMTAYRVRYEPYNRTAIEIARENGELGTLKTITTDHGTIVDTNDPSGEWRVQPELSGGGSLFDIGVYGLQAARYLSSEEPIAISAQMHSTPDDPRFERAEEYVSFLLRFPSGLIASCSSSFSYNANRVEVFGDEGSLELAPATAYYTRRLRVTKDGNVEERLFQEREEHQFARQLDHFSECIQEGRRPLTPGEEGLQDVRLMELIYEAARTGRTIDVA